MRSVDVLVRQIEVGGIRRMSAREGANMGRMNGQQVLIRGQGRWRDTEVRERDGRAEVWPRGGRGGGGELASSVPSRPFLPELA